MTLKIVLESDAAYITFKEKAELERIIYHINKDFNNTESSSLERKKEFIEKLELPATFEILSINHKTDINDELIKNYVLRKSGSKKIPFELQNICDETTNIVWLNK